MDEKKGRGGGGRERDVASEQIQIDGVGRQGLVLMQRTHAHHLQWHKSNGLALPHLERVTHTACVTPGATTARTCAWTLEEGCRGQHVQCDSEKGS